MVPTVVERFPGVWVVEHPGVRCEVTLLRSRTTSRGEFRRAAERVGYYLAVVATAGLETEPVEVETPLSRALGSRWRQPPVLVPILRAGLLLLPPFVHLFPEAQIGYLGLRRDEQTLEPRLYYAHLPAPQPGAWYFLLDPMLATGGSMQAAVEYLRGWGAERIVAVSILAAPEGIERVRRQCPEVQLVVAAVDHGLDEHGFIIPGFGDAGDRAHGTE